VYVEIMMIRKLIGSLVAVGVLGMMSGCDINNPKTTKLQFMPDMADNPTVKAQEGFLPPPPHSIPVDGILYPDSVEKAEAELVNPYPPNEMTFAKGKELYDTFCTVCHGVDGKGDGTLGDAYPVKPPDITRADLATRKDGFFFMKISQGGPIMPAYGHAISASERWLIIHHLRQLQGQGK
jgi:mono/diheme cytochrome c family protein